MCPAIECVACLMFTKWVLAAWNPAVFPLRNSNNLISYSTKLPFFDILIYSALRPECKANGYKGVLIPPLAEGFKFETNKVQRASLAVVLF